MLHCAEEERSMHGFRTVLKSPPIIKNESENLDISEKSEWKQAGESVVGP